MAGNDHIEQADAAEIAEIQARSKSWMDEFWQIVIAAPMIGAFLPGAQDFVSRGFEIIGQDAPGWYLGFVAVAVTIGLGRKAVPGLITLGTSPKP